MRAAPMTVLLCLAATSVAHADDAASSSTVSGSLGAGMFGSEPAGSLELGVDLAGEDYSLGLGGRVRWIGEDGIRTEDWDDASEIATAVRYATYRRSHEDGVGVSLAAGEIGGASLGNGAVFDGYTTGVAIDARRVGVQGRVAGDRLSSELLVDNVVAPRIAGGRGAINLGAGVRLGATAAFDRAMPDGLSDRFVPMIAMDLAVGGQTADAIARGDAYVDVAGIVGHGAGVHTGLRGAVALGDDALVLSARLEGRVHTAGYVAGWFGPLYDIERAALADPMRETAGGVGGEASVTIELPGMAAASASYDRRAGLPDQIVVRASAPHFSRVQIGLWAAANLGPIDGDRLAAGAAEVRVRLPRRLFVGADAARLYQGSDAGFSAIWLATAWVGAVLGEPR